MMNRYLFIGSSGSGKSTLAKKTSEKLSIPYCDCDSLYWHPDWKLASDKEVIRQLPLQSEAWTIDGNFISERLLVWGTADKIVWINLPYLTVLSSIIRRNIGWWISAQPIWSSNKMPLSIALSGIFHSISQLRRHKKEFPKYLEKFENKEIYILRSWAECNAWLSSLKM